jgi:hypothetical protein
MIKRTKWVEIGYIHIYNTFECFWFKCVFGLENHEFERRVFNKDYSF